MRKQQHQLLNRIFQTTTNDNLINMTFHTAR
ncbi:hypothetical protein AAUPMC_12891 [Pasteurella multocida subsp. multocida str. Anand1_cattle]|nr:hypothetical protein AAUPMC_12891 [Pasteurella multocida subsp. multocida str. Anand1_cattle]